MNKINLERKVVLLSLIPMFFMAILIAGGIYFKYEKDLLHSEKLKVKAVVETAYALIENLNSEHREGKISLEEAQKNAIKSIENLRYGEDGENYFWINDLGPKMIMHPKSKNLNGKDLSNIVDPNGIKIFVEMIGLVNQNEHGFVDYQWANDNSELADKISYVKKFKPWGWVIGSGKELTEIQLQVKRIIHYLILFILGLSTLIGGFSYYFAKKYISTPISSINGRLRTVMNQLSNSSVHLNQNSQSISEGAIKQSAATQECVAALQEMESMILRTKELSDRSLELMDGVGNFTSQGDRTMIELLESMKLIKSSSEMLQKMVDIISDITEKTQVINDIVFKTQLLSFNASIEAARAGEHGRGFSVVAEEMSNLASMSGQAAEDIRSLLEGSAQQIKDIILNTDKTVSEGELISNSASDLFKKILSSVLEVNEQVKEIVTASTEQGIGIQQTNQAMSNLDLETMKNQAIAEKSSDDAKSLEVMSKSMKMQINELTVISLGKAS